MSVLFGKQIPVSDKSSSYQKVKRDLTQLHDTINSCKLTIELLDS